MNRAAVSIPSNIAEGAGRNSDKDFSHFISMSIGSMNELQTQLILSERLGLVDSDRSREIQATLDNLQRMAIAFKTKLDNI
jgi:four helix bundle protein